MLVVTGLDVAPPLPAVECLRKPFDSARLLAALGRRRERR
jgi:hypothetical protein